MDKIKELENAIKRHKVLYYQGRPEISDSEFDKLEDELKKIDPENSILKLVGLPSVGTSPKVKHQSKMLSLNKTYDLDDLKKWIGDKEVISMFKLDGVSCSLIYKDGELALAKTRGDGTQGEDITEKIEWMTSVPKTINNKSRQTEVRGELYCDEKQFVALSDKMEDLGLERPSNQRNIVAGLMGRKDNVLLSSYIDFQAFEIIDTDEVFEKESDKFKKLKKYGFETPEIEHHKSHSSLQDVIDKAQEFMMEGNYQIDGLVFVYEDISYQNELGETSHHPRYKIAYKFAGETRTTEIKNIKWQVSRNGILTPVAEVVPVEISGAKVSRVTLHNYGIVRQYKLKKGDKIEIIRSGEVIPKFLSVVQSSKKEFARPEQCPSCSSGVSEVDIRLICENEECPAKNKESILNYFRKMGIDDISSRRLEEMLDKGLVKKIPDLYYLNVGDFYKLEKVKEKLANKLFENIQKSKKVDLVTFLSSLGISGGAQNKCEKIVHAGFNTIEKIKSLTLENLIDIESFAEKSAKDFLESLESKHQLIDELIEAGIEIEVNEKKESQLSGKKICITGPLSEKRSVIEDRIREYGGIVVNSVSAKTDYLVTNEEEATSSKHKKAIGLNLPIIKEKDLKDMLDAD